MEISEALQLSVAVILAYVTTIYLISALIKDASIIDIAWGPGFVVIAWVMLLLNSDPQIGHYVLTGLVTLWGLRLATHLFLRKRGKPEDWRYAKWRRDWGKTYWWRSYLQVNLLQGLMMFLIAAPIYVAAYNQEFTITLLGLLGILAWAKGFYFEAVGDYQLSKFISDKKNKGKIMTSGLWSYTRHPNYFGEITMWWGIFLLVAQLDYGLWAIISPLTITYLLLKVSGITMLEKKYADNKDFQVYKSKTNALIPWWPKK